MFRLGKAEWVDPDTTTASATVGGLSCDITANDWGYAVDPAAGTIDRGDACNGTSSGEVIPISEKLYEVGGPSNGTIPNITVPGNDGEETLNLVVDQDIDRGTVESMCIGEGCDAEEADNPTSYDSDELVNQSGDGMTGGLHIHKFKLSNPDSNICIGTDTRCQFGDPNPEGPALGKNNTDAEPPFVLEVNNITSHPNQTFNDNINFE